MHSGYIPIDARGGDGQGHGQGPWELGDLSGCWSGQKKHLGRCGGQRKAFQEGIRISSKEMLCELGVVLK